MRDMQTARSFTTRALARCWRGGDETPDSPRPDGIPEGLVSFAAARGSLGPVADTLKAWGLLDRLPQGDRADMKAALARSDLFNRAQSRAVSEFLSRAADSGVPVVLFKGHDLLNRYYTGDILRPTTDADILVREQDMRDVEGLLSASGFSTPERTGSNWTRGALAIDVHTGFTDARRMAGKRHLPHIPTEQIFERAKVHTLHGVPYLSPDSYHTLTMTALHALSHSYLMDCWFLDTAVVIASLGEDFSYDTFLSESERYGLGFSVEPMLWVLGSLFSYPLPEGLEGAVRPGPVLRRLIRTATERTDYLFFGEAVLGLHVDTYKKKFYYFKELLFPEPEVVARELDVSNAGPIRLLIYRAVHLMSSLVRLMLPKRRNGGAPGTVGGDTFAGPQPGWILRQKSPAAVASFPENETVLFTLSDRRPLLVNTTAREVLELTDGARTLEDVAVALSAKYGIGDPDGRAAVRRDVYRICNEFLLLGVCEHVR